MLSVNTKVNYRNTGMLTISASIVLFILFLLFHQNVIRLIETYLSSDNSITANGERELISMFLFGVAALFGIGIVLVKAQNISWRTRMKQAFLQDPLAGTASSRLSPLLVLIISSLIGLLLIISMTFTPRIPALFSALYAKDQGILDLLVSILMAISAGLLGIAVWRLRKNPEFARQRTILSVVYLLMMAAFLFYVGEETSWGQDFFKWQTPEVFSGNVENQTNLHNYFNDYFSYAYIALSSILVVMLVSIWLEVKQRWLPFSRLFLPHPALAGLALLIGFIAIVRFREQELLEEMMATFILFYSLRIFMCFRSVEQIATEQSLSGFEVPATNL